MTAKYELTDITKESYGQTLYRIRAKKSFYNVIEGDLGGFVAGPDNLSQYGDCWVYDDSSMHGNSSMHEAVIRVTPIFIRDFWSITISHEQISIGCQHYPAADWFGFDDYFISSMHSKALEWWKVWKPIIQAIHAAQVAKVEALEVAA